MICSTCRSCPSRSRNVIPGAGIASARICSGCSSMKEWRLSPLPSPSPCPWLEGIHALETALSLSATLLAAV
eukprot:15168690-Alexandrium_andersonii.AAC.1